MELNQPIKCSWKQTLEDNSTSFQDRTEENLKCYHCNGYNLECKQYMEGDNEEYKRRSL